MEYKLLSFNEGTGQLAVQFKDCPPFVVDVPVEDGHWLTGEALHVFVRGFVPTWQIERMELLKARPAGGESILAMCEHGRFAQAEPTYAERRAAEYPPITDYLDAVVKGDSSGVQTYIEACLRVKDKFPKPNDQVSAAVLAQRREL